MITVILRNKVKTYAYQIESTDAHANAAFEMHFVNIITPFPVF